MTDGQNPQPTPQPMAAAPVVVRNPKQHKSGGFGRFVRILFTPLTWVARPLVFRIGTEKGNPKVSFTSFSSLLYLWPIVLVGWIGSWLVAHSFVNPHLMGWIWITVMLIVLIGIGADIDRNKTFALLAFGLILWLGGALLEAKKGIPILSDIYDYFVQLNVQFDIGTAKVFAIAAFVILFFVVIAAVFDGRYEITTREINHKRFLRTADSLPLAAKRIKRDWRDSFEVFLGFGAGDIEVIDTNGGVVLRIPNVPFLWFFRHEVEHILEVLATTETDAAVAVAEEI